MRKSECRTAREKERRFLLLHPARYRARYRDDCRLGEQRSRREIDFEC